MKESRHEVNRGQSDISIASAQERRPRSDVAPGKGIRLAGGIYWAGGFIGFALLLSALALFLWPVQARVNSSAAEKGYWQDVLASARGAEGKFPIPTTEDLPALVDSCREAFVAEGVMVKALNVERFGGTSGQTAETDASLDHALVRLHWSGSWTGIERALAELEKDGGLGITVAEVHLSTGGGDGLLQIYFRSL